MAYEITKSDGTTLVQIGDGLIDTASASITFIGKNVVNYGEIQNENLLHMLENFADDAEPANKLTGQLWYDSSTKLLKLYNEDKWQTVATVAFSSNSSQANVLSNFWYNTSSKQLYIKNVEGYDLIGPERVAGFGETRFLSASIIDTDDIERPVIKCFVDDELIAVISSIQFAVNSLEGFSTIYRGMTLKNANTDDVTVYGNSLSSTQAGSLLSEDGSLYMSASVSNDGNTVVQRDSNGDSQFTNIDVTSITSANGLLSGNWKADTYIYPEADGSAKLGDTNYRWSEVHAQSIVTTAINAGTVSASSATINTVEFTSLKDHDGTTVTKIDADPLMLSNSSEALATQRAIKAYIDAAVAAEVAARTTATTSLQQQINVISNPPVATVCFIASSSVPEGFLEANGQAVGKDQYFNLYQALGGASTPYGQTPLTFNLPDLRGEFIRGWDNGRGVDAGRTLGSAQTSTNLTHNHGMPGDDQLSFANGYGGWTATNRGNFPYDSKSNYGGGGAIWNTTNEGTSESRPRNVALLAIIKY